MKIFSILITILLIACSTPARKISSSKSVNISPNLKDFINRVLLTAKDNAKLSEFKKVYKEDFNEKSKKFNSQNNCYE